MRLSGLTGILFLIILITAGCGVYSFRPAGKPAFESVNVAQFESKTPEYQLADRLTDAIVDAFIQDNSIEVKEASRAEAIMTGTLIGYRRSAYTYDKEDIVTEYSVKVTLQVSVKRAGTEDVIWEEDFFVEGIYNAFDETEDDGQTRAIELLTTSILDRTTKSW